MFTSRRIQHNGVPKHTLFLQRSPLGLTYSHRPHLRWHEKVGLENVRRRGGMKFRIVQDFGFFL